MDASINDASDPQENPIAEDELDDTPFNTNETRKDWRLFNVVVLGLSFMLVFTAFQTCSMVEVSIIVWLQCTIKGN